MVKTWRAGVAVALVLAFGQVASAGPVIIDGTDSNDHGGTDGAVNQDGWLYMQKALENLSTTVSNTVSKVVVSLGTASGEAFDSINSAFGKSTLPGAGWTLSHVDTAANINTWLSGLSTGNTGILYLPTKDLDGGDLADDELTAVNNHANDINNFVAGAGNPLLGGALFAQGEVGTGAYGWLSTLIPGITVTTFGGGGVGTDLSLTPDGQAAFPGLTNADLSTGPWHAAFSGDLGGLSVLATGPEGQTTRNVIIGGGAGTVIGCGEPGQPPCEEPPTGVIPEPGSMMLLGLGLAGLGLRRKKA